MSGLWGNSRAILRTTEHRPYPLPSGPWVMKQVWRDLLFAHWPIAPEVMRRVVPEHLPLDLYEDGQAYIAVVPFRMSGIRPRFLPAVPWLSAFAELNVRTYVKIDGKPGVYFFSLEAANPIGVYLGRRWFNLPYYNARMKLNYAPAGPDDSIEYFSDRTHAGAPPAAFTGVYGPTGPVYRAQPGTLEHWLTERYCLYSLDLSGRVYRGEIQHEAWPLQPATARIARNTMAAVHGVDLPDQAPLLHFARAIEVLVWNPERLS